MQQVCAEPGGLARLFDEILDDQDPDGAADRKAARDARRKARDENLESEPYGPEAMDGSRRVTAEDRAFFTKLYPDAVLPEFIAEKVQRGSRPAPVSSAITIKDIYPNAEPVNHAPGSVTRVII
jgi:hypothetical protein